VFSMSSPAGELIARAALVYLALLFLMRVSGKRTVGQFTPFDLLVMLLLSEGVSNALSGGEDSLTGGLLVAVVLIGMNYLASVLTARSERAKWLLEGSPKVLGRDGRLDRVALRRENVAEGDVLKRLREDHLELADVAVILLETDGHISFVEHGGRTGPR
jgi:uncharacterized membrane protein YcaP (DUF421 family)